jgi:hypothetical protein
LIFWFLGPKISKNPKRKSLFRKNTNFHLKFSINKFDVRS